MSTPTGQDRRTVITRGRVSGMMDLYRRKRRTSLPASLGHAAKLSDLMATEEGRAWWKENGVSTDLTFDLKPGSPNLDYWERYRRIRSPE